MLIPTIILIALVPIALFVIHTDWFARLVLGGMYDWLMVKVIEK